MTQNTFDDANGNKSDWTPEPLPRYERRQEVVEEIKELHSVSKRQLVRILCQPGGPVHTETLVYFVRHFRRAGMEKDADSILETINARIAPRVVRFFAGVFGSNAEDREDLVHDALVDALAAIVSTEPRNAFWEVHFNYCLKRRLQERLRAYIQSTRRTGPGKDAIEDIMGDNGLDPLLAEWIVELLRRLPPQEEIVVYLHVICEYTEKEIAEMQGCSERTVRNRLKRGLARLRELADDEGLSP
ncbi:MAG: RNA polymerase sigma factor [Chthonomonadales bacterium]